MWARLDSTVSARECSAVSLPGGRLLTFGGMWSEGGELVLSNEAHVYDAKRGSWAKLETSGLVPRARTGAALVAIPDTELVLVAHGLNHDVGYLSDVCLLNVRALKWTHAALNGQLPSARDKLAAAACDNQVYIHGGFGVLPPGEDDEEEEDGEDDEEEGRRSVKMGWHDDLYAFDPQSHAVRLIEVAGAKPAPRAAHSLVALGGGSLVLFGGRTQAGRCNDLWRLDVRAAVWQPIAAGGAPPAPRSFQSACALPGSRLVVFGGLDARDAHLADLHVFDAAAERWEQPAVARGEGASAGPCARGSCALGAAGGSLLVFGGSSGWVAEMGAPSTFHADMFALPLSALPGATPARPGAEAEAAPHGEQGPDEQRLGAERPDKRARVDADAVHLGQAAGAPPAAP